MKNSIPIRQRLHAAARALQPPALAIALLLAVVASVAMALPAETEPATQKSCPEGALRLEDGGCAVPPRDALLATSRCDPGKASYAGSCWELSDRAVERIRERARTDGLRPERDGCISGTVLIGERCVPLAPRQEPEDFARTVASLKSDCSTNCPPGTVCAGAHCLRATPISGRTGWCGESPPETFDEKNCRYCYRGVWYAACSPDSDNCNSCR